MAASWRFMRVAEPLSNQSPKRLHVAAEVRKAVRPFANQVECGWEGSCGHSPQRLFLLRCRPRTAEIEVKASQTILRPMSGTAEEPTDSLGTATDPMMRPTSSAPRVPTPSKDTRTCNKLRPVNRLTSAVT